MRVLVLGGGGFVGRHAVSALLAGGHAVTVFTRGVSPVRPEVAHLRGDRETGDLASLAGTSWDAVVDVTGYRAGQVEAVAGALADVGRYLFVSSHAVYDDRPGDPPGADETTPRRPPLRDPRGPLDNDTYGPAKVACEDAVVAAYGERARIVRPGKVIGPFDNQPSVLHWVRAAEAGGPVEVPDPDAPVQLVDARDLAVLVVRMLEEPGDARGGLDGAVQAVGESVSFATLVRTCAEVAGTEVELVPPRDPAARFPLWQPERPPASRQRSHRRARAAGLPATPLATSLRDVLAWDRDRRNPSGVGDPR